MEASNLIENIAFKIANEAVPDEIDLASEMTYAFMEGGEAKKELFQNTEGSLPGAFGTGEILVLFPLILKALSSSAPLIWTLLNSNILELPSVINECIEIHKNLNNREKKDLLSDDPYKPLKIVITTVSAELQSTGLPQEQCDLVTYKVMRALLDCPSDSAIFIQKLGGIS
jgi:hypothetical protein